MESFRVERWGDIGYFVFVNKLTEIESGVYPHTELEELYEEYRCAITCLEQVLKKGGHQ